MKALQKYTLLLFLGYFLLLVDQAHAGYDPTIGRWLSRDPIGNDGGPNLYGYVFDNPINGIDLFGLDCFFNQSDGLGAHAWVSIGGDAPNRGNTYGAYPDGDWWGKPEIIQNPDSSHGGQDETGYSYQRLKTTPEDEASLNQWIKDHYKLNSKSGDPNNTNPNYNLPTETCRQFRERVKIQLMKIIRARKGKIEISHGRVP